MDRFMGIMPSEEIKIRKYYDDGHGLKVHIDAGDSGWTIMYADYSTEYKDTDKPAVENLEEALSVLKKHFKGLKEITSNECYDEALDLEDLVEKEI